MPDSPPSNSPECRRSSSSSWNRSVKRKLDSPPPSPVSVHRHRHHQPRNIPSPPSVDVLARVEIENERYALRETLSRQQMTINQLYVELDEERNAAASAAEEAMSMILRLQREKAEVEMDGRQFRRFVEERIAHDQEEIRALEDVHYRHDQAMQALSFEVQAYRHRLLSYGIDPDDVPRRRYELEEELEEEEDMRRAQLPNDADVQNDINGCVSVSLDDDVVVDDSGRRSFDTPVFDYPPLRCTTCNDEFNQPYRSVVVHEHLQNIDQPQTHQMDKSSRVRDNATSSTLLARDVIQNQATSNGNKHRDSDDVEFREHVSDEDNENHNTTNEDRVYTVDTDYGVTQLSNDVGENTKKVDVKNLYRRLQILEADRESLKKAIISSRNDKAQLSLLKEIAQNLTNKNGAARSDVYVAERRMVVKRSLSFLSLFKSIASLILWRKKASRIKYSFGLSNHNAGLLYLVDKTPQILRPWRCLTKPRVPVRVPVRLRVRG